MSESLVYRAAAFRKPPLDIWNIREVPVGKILPNPAQPRLSYDEESLTELASSIDMVRRARAELGVTVLWVEHVMKAVMTLAERVLVLNFGRLIADGKPQVVMRQPDVVTAYLGEQGVA